MERRDDLAAESELIIATWNVNTFNNGRIADKRELLAMTAWDVALLQEVNPPAFAAFCELEGVTGAHAVDLVGGAWDRRSHGVAILVRDDASLDDAALIPIERTDLEPDEWRRARLMCASVHVSDHRLAVASFHAPHAAGPVDERDRNIARKMLLYRSLHTWCRAASGSVVVGMDANTWVDQIDIPAEPDDARFADEQGFHARGADHGLRDVYLDYLVDRRPDVLERRRRLGAEGVDGSLAVTYQHTSNNHPRTNRMDRIYASTDLEAEYVETLYDDALTVGSDHALVVATLVPSARNAPSS